MIDARLSQLPAGIFLGVRFAGDLTVQYANLIGAYNKVIGVARSQALRFGLRQPGNKLTRGFFWAGRFVDVRRRTFKW